MQNNYICQLCKQKIETPDYGDGNIDESDVYDYRGFYFHEKCFDEGIKRVDEKRDFVMEVTKKSVESQRNGEFANNRGKYHLGNVASDGLPIMKVKEPQVLKDYENGIL